MSYFVHLNKNSFVFKKEEAETQPSIIGARVVEVDADTFTKVGIGWRFVDGEWIGQSVESDGPIQCRIDSLLENLRGTDCIILESLEYKAAGEDAPSFDEVHKQRQEWRKEISELQKILEEKGEVSTDVK